MEETTFETLKTFSGIIYRQPLFTLGNSLTLYGYQLSFLDTQGNDLADDGELPEFIDDLPKLIATIAPSSNILLSIPASWQQAIAEQATPAIKLTFVLKAEQTISSDAKHLGKAYFAHQQHETQHGDILLVDLKQHGRDDIETHLPNWQQNYKETCVVNVDSTSIYEECKHIPAELIQGQFYKIPVISDANKLSPSNQTLLELLVKLQDPDTPPEDLAETINQDVSLSYKLLRLINSAFFGLPREISSTKQAIVMLGHNKIKTWASLLSLSGLDDKPSELRVLAMVRARMCELLATYYKGDADMFFAAGLFSTLDTLMDKPLAMILERLPLSPELTEALLEKSGVTGQALSDVLNYEDSNWQGLTSSSLPVEVLANAYIEALNWASQLNLQLKD
jgi:EAL and modified HD-GYP domain-containing signal transduction protein